MLARGRTFMAGIVVCALRAGAALLADPLAAPAAGSLETAATPVAVGPRPAGPCAGRIALAMVTLPSSRPRIAGCAAAAAAGLGAQVSFVPLPFCFQYHSWHAPSKSLHVIDGISEAPPRVRAGVTALKVRRRGSSLAQPARPERSERCDCALRTAPRHQLCGASLRGAIRPSTAARSRTARTVPRNTPRRLLTYRCRSSTLGFCEEVCSSGEGARGSVSAQVPRV